jgi:hypothetical protein
MSIQVEFWDLVTLLISFFGFLGMAGKLLLSQIDRRLESRFEEMEKVREQASQHWNQTFASVIDQNRIEAKDWAGLERQFLEFKAELPVQYVRREDYVRGQSVIEAKLDALYNKLEVVRINGAHHA